MKKLLEYLKEYRKEAVLAPGFKLLEAIFELFVPLVMARIIDVGIPNGDMPYILKMGLILLLLACVGLTVSITAQYFAARAAVGTAASLRQAVFDHIMELDFTGVDRAGTSTLITRMTSDINQVQSGINMTLRLFLRSPIIVFGAMIMAFTIDVKSALIFVVAIPLLALVVYGIMAITMPKYRKVQSLLDRVLGTTRENLTGVRVIRAFHMEEREEEKFHAQNEELTAAQTHVARISAVTNPVTYVIVNAAIIYLIYTGAVKVNIGDLTQGQVVALLNYMNQILVELIKLANLIVTMSKAVACAGRVADVLELPAGPGVEAGAEKSGAESIARGEDGEEVPFLAFDHVSLTYDGAGDATLKDIDFRVRKGETIGIIGGTGSGKSSLVNLIPGFYRASEGAVRLEGRDIKEIPEKEIRGRIGIVPQKAVLFRGTIRSNLLWGNPEAGEEQLWKAIDLAQAGEIVRGKEGGLDAEVAQGGRNFSGGQRQRLTIARALVREPEILILDDSASALDFLTESRLKQALAGLRDTTVFIVTQRASSILHADKILVLDDGQIVGMGRHEELLASCEVYREIYESQYETKGKEA